MVRVMVVDDEDVLVEMLAAVLEDIGYEPIVATNALDALAMLSADGTPPPALIITDVMMPKMNGVEFARRARALEQLRAVPIIMMSAAGAPVDTRDAACFLHKPFDMDVLVEVIEQYLQPER